MVQKHIITQIERKKSKIKSEEVKGEIVTYACLRAYYVPGYGAR